MAVAWLALCLALTAAKRPVEDLNDGILAPNLQDQASSSMLQSGTSSCDQDGANLREALRKLGVAEDDMHDTHYCKWTGVYCDEEEKCVEWLELPDKNLVGVLGTELGQLARLTHVWLGQNMHLSGDLQDLRPLRHLEQLDIPNTNITGGLDVLRDMKELTYLFLFEAPVHGKLEDLKDLKQLRKLSASRTEISGSLEALQELSAIKEVLLAETHVTGQLTALRGLESLTRLDLSKTNVTGTLQDLLNFSKLEQVMLRNTRVAGGLTPEWAGRLKALSVLDLADTQVHWVPTVEGHHAILALLQGGDPLLPYLTVLDVSGCPLNSSVERLLWPMAWSQWIAKIVAARSGLTGTLPYMADHELTVSLQTLDLSENNISRVEGLVAGGLLSLARNFGGITFAEGVLRKAFRRKVKLDLKGVTLTAEQAGEALEMLPPLRTELLMDRDRLACPNLQATVLDVTPQLFLADQLCRCADGHARLDATNLTCFKCFTPDQARCNSSSSSKTWKDRGCAEGYEGVLCSVCAEKFRSRVGRCERCDEAAGLARGWLAGAVLLVTTAAGLYVTLGRKDGSTSSPETQALIPLLLGQGPVLLQFFQLWGVLVGLMPAETNAEPESEQEIARWLQLTAASVRDALSLECSFGRKAWSISAFASPTLPLLLLMLCLLVEIAHWSRAACWKSRGRGVDWALKVLLLFFVGGAASCEKLLRCQKVDAGDEPLNEHSFRVALPHLRCKDHDMESAWALYVGYGSAFAYGIMIPSFLVYLIAKQNLELAINRRCVCWWTKENQGKQVIAQAKLIEPLEDDAETAEDKPEVAQQDDGPGDGDNPDAAPFPYSWQQDSSTAAELQAKHQDPVEAAREKSEPVDGGNPDEEIVSANLLAAAIAYAAVFFRGEVTIERKPDSMTLEQKDGDENDKFTEIDATSIFSTIFSSIASKEHKTDIDIRRCQSITRMLAEHEVIEKKAEDDRILAGAKTIFFKYAACDDVWVEASLKVVAVALVTTVSVDSALLTLFITVGMAILLGAQKPYKQRQVNDLQSGCFICLSMAALGFWLETPEIPGRLLARLALVLPFLAAGVQMLRPDGPEALALRLHQEAKAKLKESKSVELSVKKVKFI